MKLKEVRLSRGYTQRQLADKVSCDRSMIAKIELGVHSPSLGLLVKLAEALSCSLDELVIK